MADDDDMKKAMGFSNFGGPKMAKQFDLLAMVEQSRNIAKERSAATAERSATISNEYKPGDPTTTAAASRPNAGPARGPAPATQSKAADSSNDDSDDDDDDNTIGPPIPKNLASKSKESDDDDDELIGPPVPKDLEAANISSKSKNKNRDSDDDSDDDEDDEEEDDNPVKKIPASHEVILDHGDRTVSALTLDPSGARLCTGGMDYYVKFWDFSGMDASLRSFRSIKPCESHPIKTVEYSPTGEQILIVSGNAQAKVVDRDGHEVLECVKGDQYLSDMKRTKGHVAMLNCGCWNLKKKEEFMTCSNDGSVRLWDVHQGGKQHKDIMKPRAAGGHRAIPTACTYSPDGRYIAVACNDGSLQFWDHHKKFLVNVAMMNRDAHQKGTETSSLSFSYDGHTLASRGGDNTVKLWDIRKIKSPLCVAENLQNSFPTTDCCFSPDDKMVLTGISVTNDEETGKVVFLDKLNLKTLHEMPVVQGASVVRTLWHPKLNQMVMGCGDGKVRLYYDADKSYRGATLCVVKTRRKKKQVEIMTNTWVVTPHALPMFKVEKETGTRKREVRERKDPVKSHRPDMPIHGPGTGGRVAQQGGSLSQYVAQLLVKRKPDERDKDPRAAILRHAEAAKANPYWIDPAYKDSQPKQVFQEVAEDAEDPDQPVWKKQKL